MCENHKYPLVLYEETGCGQSMWIGNFPALNGCWVEGESREEVLEKAPFVLRAFIDACAATGWPMPSSPNIRELLAAEAGEVAVIEAAPAV